MRVGLGQPVCGRGADPAATAGDERDPRHDSEVTGRRTENSDTDGGRRASMRDRIIDQNPRLQYRTWITYLRSDDGRPAGNLCRSAPWLVEGWGDCVELGLWSISPASGRYLRMSSPGALACSAAARGVTAMVAVAGKASAALPYRRMTSARDHVGARWLRIWGPVRRVDGSRVTGTSSSVAWRRYLHG